MSLNWQKLRSWNGSQHLAFEELCCQLAAVEPPLAGSRFFRKGTPDAGVECFWQLPNGDEWAWQAKFFLSPPSARQWSEVDGSVKTALAKHPRLTKYIICFPSNLPDPREKKQSSFCDKWNKRVDKWRKWTATKTMAVEFEYWDESAVALRLSREEHRGRHWFWFTEERLSLAWFHKCLEEAIANAGERYTPELNVELPISKYFDAVGRTLQFYDEATRLYGEMRKAYSSLSTRQVRIECETEFQEVDSRTQNLWVLCEAAFLKTSAYLSSAMSGPIAWAELAEQTSHLLELCNRIGAKLRKLQEAAKSNSEPQRSSVQKPTADSGHEFHRLSEFRGALSEFGRFCEGRLAMLSDMPAMLLIGTAGQGKTHLLCDVAQRDLKSGIPRILLHGEQFNDGEPWQQIVRLLGLDCTKDEFLGALEAAAQASRCRLLIFIDALNEGEGRGLWQKHFSGMLTAFARSPWLGIVVSVRESYEDLVIPGGLVPKRLIRIEHTGFQEHEYEAMHSFFSHYGIQPTSPLLVPEFSNPLFLKLFCRGLKNHGLTQVPTGLRGITAVMQFFLDAVNKRLAKPDCLDYDEHCHLVRQAVEELAATMAEKQTYLLSRTETVNIVNFLLPSSSYDKSLFRHLIAEGVLAEDRWPGESGAREIVRFTYERFADHLIAKYLLDKYLKPKALKRSFAKRAILGSLCKDEHACWRNQGLIEALSIQLPERVQLELTELAPHTVDYQSIRRAFIESFTWRDVSAFTESTRHYINQHIARYVGPHLDFLDALLTVAPIPKHPFNADRLHKHLIGFKLADRDAWWSVFLHGEWGAHRAVNRLVDWAWRNNDKSQVPDEVMRLTGMAMVWFLTSSNRYLRDRTTKALVRLFERRILCLRKILPAFHNVNDPYVMERLLAVAYGCALRSVDVEAIVGLAQDIYDWIFHDGQPPPHILLRDYARGVIEIVLHKGATLNVDADKIRPPYCSDWPSFKIPDLGELTHLREWKDKPPNEEWSRVHLYSSLMEAGDFSRYVVGNLREWSSEKLGEPHKPNSIDLYRRSDAKTRGEIFKREFSQAELDVELQYAESELVKTLGKHSKKYQLFRNAVASYIAQPHIYSLEDHFDSQLARRWMLQKVINLGWSVERFGKFDRNTQSSYGREAQKSERIGKKYQWIAFHELLARLSDNFKLRKDKWFSGSSQYHGPWDVGYRRDLDPSNLLRKTERERWGSSPPTWWSPIAYNNWEIPIDEVAWLKNTNDLPAVESLIEVTAPTDLSRWFVMESFYQWEQLLLPGEDRYEVPRRRIWYMLNSYLVRRRDAEKVFAWAKKQNFMGRWMPESHESTEIFLGEFFWSPVFQDHDQPYFHRDGWTRGGNNSIPAKLLVTSDAYMQEMSTFDCSLDDTIIISLPCKFLADGMGMHWAGEEGHFLDDQGSLIAFDPSVRSLGPGALLIRKDSLLEFLNANDLQIVWTLLGEKEQIGGTMTQRDYKGSLEINGAYRFDKDAIQGTKSCRFLEPHRPV